MRALVISNMAASERDPARGVFVRDQVQALRRLPDVSVELFEFRSAGGTSYVRAARDLRRSYGAERFDVVHAHFGLTLWPALLGVRRAPHAVTLHGTDLVHPRSRAITVAGLPLMDLVAPVSDELSGLVPRRLVRGALEVLPCGVNLERVGPVDRFEARRRLGLEEAGPYLLFPSNPARSEKRFDRARKVAADVPLLTLGNVPPDQVGLWINAANAVLVTSERESFGLGVLEALACDVPVLSTPVGVAPDALYGVAGCHCGPFDAGAWQGAVAPLLGCADPRVQGRAVAERYSADAMARRVLAAWEGLARQ